MAGVRLLPLVAFVSTAVAHVTPAAFAEQSPLTTAPVSDNNTRVPIVLGVMSRCPDALLCEAVLDGALKETWDIVNINLSFVGKLNESVKEDPVTCLHGPEECEGNVQELCAMNHADTQEDWWHFLQCLNFEGKDQVGDKALAKRCAGVALIPWEDEKKGGVTTRQGIKRCVESQEGKDLLRASVKRSQALGIEKSCTIMISGEKRCVHDGTWKNCETGHSVEDFIGYIQEEYQRLNNQDAAENLG